SFPHPDVVQNRRRPKRRGVRCRLPQTRPPLLGAVPAHVRRRWCASLSGSVAHVSVRSRGTTLGRRPGGLDATLARRDASHRDGRRALLPRARRSTQQRADARVARRVPADDPAVLRSRLALLGGHGFLWPRAPERSPRLGGTRGNPGRRAIRFLRGGSRAPGPRARKSPPWPPPPCR